MTSDAITLSKVSVFVSGNFFILHPGHIRFLRFAAECGSRLIIGVNNTRPNANYPSPAERSETLRSLGFVDDVFVIEGSLESTLRLLRPDIVVKGKEYEAVQNIEAPILKEWNGSLIFSSGESTYSASDLLTTSTPADIVWVRPQTFLRSHTITIDRSRSIVSRFSQLKVVVVGDLIVDEYVHCEALGMSREDPTVVVSPQRSDRFLGGAGIVAAHAAALGADTQFVSITGPDEPAEWSKHQLLSYGVKPILFPDRSRPTSLKMRYRVGVKTMLRVSHLRQHEAMAQISALIREKVEELLSEADLLVFADFNYGCLPQSLVDPLISKARNCDVLIAADSQASSQLGNVARFEGVDLITPTEHEARLAVRDHQQSLTTLGVNLLKISNAKRAFLTLGSSGLMVFENPVNFQQSEPERLPALNPNPVDVAGAGDSLLVCAGMALALGADSHLAAYLGSIAAAIQTSRIGNTPIKQSEMLKAIH